ncbi:threonine/serine dehydratase [Haloechinothrix sp. YIM 98757]|uniref:threonine ammonia-lyase n=1 Tax=Haloechinothrix aidingensis TaxID=2752311 RepID=A0A838AES0_9PSEU|nr:threonine/serine dehydratase [Haloechinothrix aidingensis]
MDRVTITDIEAAARRTGEAAVRTPLLAQPWSTGRPLWLKPESLQPTGAFKIRGAYNAIAALDDADRARGVVTYSSGNHASAVARAAWLFGVPATIVMQDSAPQVKVTATAAYGAEIVTVAMADREREAQRLAEEHGRRIVPPFDHPDVIAGQGTVGIEIVEQLGDVDVVLVPVGGGGLASGVGTAVRHLRPHAAVVAVEPELAGDTAQGLREGHRVDWPGELRARTVADGLRTQPSELTFAHLTEVVDAVVTVTEQEIRDAVHALALRSRLVAEPSGAVAVAAALYRDHELPQGRTVAVVSGGNIDADLLTEIVCAG